MNRLTRVAGLLRGIYEGENSLYKDDSNGEYLLLLTQSGHTPEDFAKVCNLLSEYGNIRRTLPSSNAYLEEHYTMITLNNALQSLGQIL